MKYKSVINMTFVSLTMLVVPTTFAQPSYLDEGLIAYYPFNGNANDESGNANDGTVFGATLTTDRQSNMDSAYYFGGDDYIQTPVNSNIKPLSFSVWFRAENVSGERSIVDSDVSGNYGHSLIIGYETSDSDLDVQYHNGYMDSGYLVQTDRWYHAVVNYSDKIQLYIDGQLVDEQAYPTNTFDGSNFRFGRHNALDPQWFVGKIDDIRFYDRTLSECEILSLYTGEKKCVGICIAPLGAEGADSCYQFKDQVWCDAHEGEWFPELTSCRASFPDIPLLLTIDNFSALRSGGRVEIELITSSEKETSALYVFRAPAILQRPQQIIEVCRKDSMGRNNSGYTYSCYDENAPKDVIYWPAELDDNGNMSNYLKFATHVQ
jgi:hypothetical protein